MFRICTKKILFNFIINSLWKVIFVKVKEFFRCIDWRQLIFCLLKDSLVFSWCLFIVPLFKLFAPFWPYLFLYQFLIGLIVFPWFYKHASSFLLFLIFIQTFLFNLLNITHYVPYLGFQITKVQFIYFLNLSFH